MNQEFRKTRALIFSLAFALGPVYWLPSISPSIVSFLKASLLTLGIFMTLPRSEFKIPQKLIIWSLCLLTTLLASQLKSQQINNMSLMIIPAIVIFFYNAPMRNNQEDISRIILWTTYIFLFFQLLVVFDFFRGGAIPNPLSEADLPLYMTGFHGGRTGWASGVIVVFATYLSLNFNKGLTFLMFFFVSLVTLLDLLIVGSRGGLFAFVALFIVQYFLRTRRKGPAFVFPIVLAAGSGVLLYQLPELIRGVDLRVISFLFTDVEGYFAPDSATREFGNLIAFEVFWAHPIFGTGSIDLREHGADYQLIHNAYLKIAAENGALVLMSLMSFLVVQTYRNFKDVSTEIRAAAFFSVVAGSILAMVEPISIFGSFFSSFFVWFLFGISVARNGR